MHTGLSEDICRTMWKYAIIKGYEQADEWEAESRYFGRWRPPPTEGREGVTSTFDEDNNAGGHSSTKNDDDRSNFRLFQSLPDSLSQRVSRLRGAVHDAERMRSLAPLGPSHGSDPALKVPAPQFLPGRFKMIP